MRTPRIALCVGLALGVVAGVVTSHTPTALASRNSSGTYSLPHSPVQAGQTISTTWANSTLADLSTEITSSLDRSGRGAMLAPLQLANGAAGAPALTWGSDTDTGLYRAGAGDMRAQVDATLTQKWTSTLVSFPVDVTVAGAGTTLTVAPTGTAVAVVATGANGDGVQATGNGSGASGVLGTGGSAGAGVYGQGGATSGAGVVGVGTGSGQGGVFTGGATGNGLWATGGATGGQTGVVGTGGAGGAGVIGVAGTAATSSTRQPALAANQGDLYFTGVTNPASTTAVSNTLTAKNFIKAWANITTNGSGGVTVTDGFNIASVALTGVGNNDLRVSFNADFASAGSYACTVTNVSASPHLAGLKNQAAGSIDIWSYDVPIDSVDGYDTSTFGVHLVCVGAQ